ncbi:MAG: EamA family transporter, partial [Burkholderiales bacterium]
IVLASASLLGLRLALSGRLLRRVNEVRLAFWQGAISLPLFAAGALATETIRFDHIGFAPLAGIFYQGAIVAGLAFTVNFTLIRRYTPSVIISFNFVAPVAGVLLGASILGEPVTAGLVGGLLLVAAGLVLIARK